MARKIVGWKTKGMNKDLSVSAFNSEFSFDNLNLRLFSNNSNTQLSWVNEKGTKEITLLDYTDYNSNPSVETPVSITGTPIGTAVLNNKLVLFTTSRNNDYIYRLEYCNEAKDKMLCKVLFDKKLNFKVDHPIETLVSYESENIQKIYWVDGINQPRVINIVDDDVYNKDSSYFDFVRELDLQETVKVEKQLGASGMFAPGVIQYAFTYYDKYTQETNIFYTTPLYYISNTDRGVSPEGKVENAFKITVDNVEKDKFDFLRIYSIQRTSLDATPICKRVQDISLKGITGTSVSYLDTGLNGDTVDPTELLYKGGEEITAETIEQKDSTLFLGNIKDISLMKSSDLTSIVTPEQISFITNLRQFTATPVSQGEYYYANQLTSTFEGETVPCSGFKSGDYYRFGVQFQYKTGKWSRPIFIRDYPINNNIRPHYSNNVIFIPRVEATITPTLVGQLLALGYKRVRPLVVFPNIQDRNTICQGVVCPTLYTQKHRETDKNLYAQSSWFFRPIINESLVHYTTGTVSPVSSGTLEYAGRDLEGMNKYNPKNLRQVEIQGYFNEENKFKIDNSLFTFHSPDVEFDDHISLLDFQGLKGVQVGKASFTNTFSDIDIQTETPPVGTNSAGFKHKSFIDSSSFGIVAGFFYEDFILNDWNPDKIWKEGSHSTPYSWMVYPWNSAGSLNNDFVRPANLGTQTAKLKKKVLSNLRYSKNTVFNSTENSFNFTNTPQMFLSDETTILKLANNITYQGNIDTMLVPDAADGKYFVPNTLFTAISYGKTFSTTIDQVGAWGGTWFWNGSNRTWNQDRDDIGDYYIDLAVTKGNVRMRYKSTPHIVFTANIPQLDNNVVEIRKANLNTDILFGGKSEDAFRENTWIPCGKSVPLNASGTTYRYEYGDTYYQRWDCLKTYAFSREDINQVVEIGSFMLETHINLDGRYDRNRGQLNNLNMSPQNFNLINLVYSQVDNFFSYKIMDEDSYKNTSYPNQITWSKTKESGADIDAWTNVTLASVLALDGDKGKITSLQRLNDQLIAFQDSGIAQILYNENTQISTTQGVPIEIANSGKVQGKRYLSNSIGCSNKWSIVSTSNGIYFMDSNDKSIYFFNGQLVNLSQQGGFNSWSKNNIPSSNVKWDPASFSNFVGYYDRINKDVLYINSSKALAWSEKTNTFTSFYDYGNIPFFCNIFDTGVWIDSTGKVWKHQAGGYCNFFGTNKSYSMILIGNPDPQLSKIYTNLEFRANVDKDGTKIEAIDTFDDTFDDTFHPDGNNMAFIPTLPFTNIEVWNEYQHGIANFTESMANSYSHFKSNGESSLKRKFRIWRCDIPRDNYPLVNGRDIDDDKGISRYYRKPMDRMRNPWLYLKLTKEASEETMHRTEIHDIVMTYFD